eukprot:64218-Pelagomonas_calceolata.AAC.1
MASPLDHNPQYQHYWSTNHRDTLFGAHHNSFLSKFTGLLVCRPIYDEDAMTQPCVMPFTQPFSTQRPLLLSCSSLYGDNT